MKKCYIYIAATLVMLMLAALSPLNAAPDYEAVPAKLGRGEPVKIKMNVLFIYDSSGSMWGMEDGKTKVELSRKILNDIIDTLPPDASLGLLAYGHRQKNACGDIQLIAPIGSKNADEIKHIANALQPKGITPLSESLRQAADAFKGVEGAKMIVLITDGAEECGGDPCAVTRQLALGGLVVRVNVVGMIPSKESRSQLECVAKEGAGRFFDVTSRQTMQETVQQLSQDIKTYVPPAPPQPKPPVQPQPRPPAFPLEAPRAIAPPPKPAADLINLLEVKNGGHLVEAESNHWENTISGRENETAWTWTGQEATFAFKDDEPATFSRFELAITGWAPQNVQSFELYASKDSPDGPFFLIGRFNTANTRKESLYQVFTFEETTARYLKFKLISNYGYEMQGWGNTQVNQMRLMGKQ